MKLLCCAVCLLAGAGWFAYVGVSRTAVAVPGGNSAIPLPDAAPAPAPARVPPAREWGSIKGQLVYAGMPIPAPGPLKVTTNPEHCLAKGPVLDKEWVVNGANKGVKNVFVWLSADGSGTAKPPIHPDLQAVPKQPVVIDQPQCMFEPYASVMREGQDLVVKNSSPVAHNANYSGSRLRNPGANPIVPAGKQEVIKLKWDRLPVRLSCSIHGWMKGYVGVYDHPYFALTDENGSFEIKQAPAGEFRLFIWHEGAGWRLREKGGQGEPITIKAGQPTDLGKLDIQKLD